jgi:hypothetical protein
LLPPVIMPSSDSSSKIQFSSNLDVQNEYLHEKVTDPHSSTSKTTIASNNIKYEAKGVDEPKVTEGEAVDVNPATVGCDTSQL